MKILIKSGRVIDPANTVDTVCDILVENGRICKVAKNLSADAETIIDAKDKIVMPGLVDMHVHLREPGREDKETIFSGTRAALKGGVTSLLAMPNTQPAPDCASQVKLIKEIINSSAQANVFICGAITEGRKGLALSKIEELKAEGITAISDDGSSVDSDELMRQALLKAKENKITVICHCEDKTLSNQGVVNLGLTSTRMGVRGISRESEYLRISRDIGLAQDTGASIHIAHVSCAESVKIIAQAKKKGVRVTAESCPHYFALNEEAVLSFDPNMKMNPPLRRRDDWQAIRQGLGDGTIDVIASDHAPHTENEKEIEFERAEFGVVGLETELAVAITELIENNILNWSALVQKLCLRPAQILGINKGTLGIGADADITVVNPQREWVVNKDGLISKSRNSCFLNRRLKGVVEYTLCSGKIAYGIHS